MGGYLLLEGGAEFGGAMDAPDRRAMELTGGADALLCVLPTAAAPDHNHARAGENARRWFTHLGARRVEVLPLIDTASARDAQICARLRAARLIYLLGGFPHYLGQTLLGSPAWEAATAAYRNGAVLGGSSAGAMVLCQHYFDPHSGKIQPGLNLLPGACVLPHHNRSGKNWAEKVRALLPEAVLVGIDERTGMINDGPGGGWQVYGAGAVTIYPLDGAVQVFRVGDAEFQV